MIIGGEHQLLHVYHARQRRGSSVQKRIQTPRKRARKRTSTSFRIQGIFIFSSEMRERYPLHNNFCTQIAKSVLEISEGKFCSTYDIRGPDPADD